MVRSGAVALGFAGLRRAYADGILAPAQSGYGPLVRDPQKVMDLPAGFSYQVFSKFGAEMDDGLLVPGQHDGMAAFPGPGGKTILVRNHEVDPTMGKLGAFGPAYERLAKVAPAKFYDYCKGNSPCAGGTTTVVYDTASGRVERQFLSLVGTLRNCAGGPTPWGSWLTCEEYVGSGGPTSERPHGFVFEVPARPDLAGPVDPVPLAAMGRFYREAVAVDPGSGCVYQSEDLGDGLIYRFVPKERERLAAGGTLQTLVLREYKRLDTRNWSPGPAVRPGESFDAAWVDLEDVLAPKDDLRYQGFDKGAARFARTEGMWFGRGAVYFCATNGGAKQKGQIWRYTPSPLEGTPQEETKPGRLELFLEPNDGTVLENCDNLTVAPWGDLIVCEDEVGTGDGQQFLRGVTPEGHVYTLGRNAESASELAGATFSPDGTTLFVNIQTPGKTLAIRGPWKGPAGRGG